MAIITAPLITRHPVCDTDALGQARKALGPDDERLGEHYLSAVDWAARIFDSTAVGV